MSTPNKHIQASGPRQGQWVNCQATQKCRLSNSAHITEKTLHETQQWLENKKGSPVPLKNITETDVLNFRDMQEFNLNSAERAALKREEAHVPVGVHNPDVQTKNVKKHHKEENKKVTFKEFFKNVW